MRRCEFVRCKAPSCDCSPTLQRLDPRPVPACPPSCRGCMLCIHPSCIDGPQCSKAGELDSKSGWGGSIPSGVATDERYCWLIELVPAPSSIHTADVKPARYACDPRKYHTHVTECPYSAMHFPTRAEAEAAFPHLPFVAGWSFLVTDHLFTHQRANREAPPAQGPTVNGAAIFGAIKLKDIT